MMTYEYVCRACGKLFEVRASMAEYSKGLKPTCPHCGAKSAIRAFSNISVLTSRPRGGNMPLGCGPNAGPGCCG